MASDCPSPSARSSVLETASHSSRPNGQLGDAARPSVNAASDARTGLPSWKVAPLLSSIPHTSPSVLTVGRALASAGCGVSVGSSR
jgi:hypothetical protein